MTPRQAKRARKHANRKAAAIARQPRRDYSNCRGQS